MKSTVLDIVICVPDMVKEFHSSSNVSKFSIVSWVCKKQSEILTIMTGMFPCPNLIMSIAANQSGVWSGSWGIVSFRREMLQLYV